MKMENSDIKIDKEGIWYFRGAHMFRKEILSIFFDHLRTDEDGKFIWPGFSDNLRVLLWILARCNSKVDAVNSPIGYLPKLEDIDLEDTDISVDTLKGLLSIDKHEWIEELADQDKHLSKFEKLPEEIRKQYNDQKARISNLA